MRFGITYGFNVIRTLYGDKYAEELYQTLRETNGNNPIKIYFVDTDVNLISGGYTGGANQSDFGIIYINADALTDRNTLSATIAHELQHYYYALTVKDGGFMNEVYSNYCDNLTARNLQNTSGEWADLYAEGHDVFGHISNPETLQSYMGADGIRRMMGEDGLTASTGGNYYLYTAFGYYLQYCTTTNGTLTLNGGMSGLLSYLEEAGANSSDSTIANYHALFRAFNNGTPASSDAQA